MTLGQMACVAVVALSFVRACSWGRWRATAVCHRCGVDFVRASEEASQEASQETSPGDCFGNKSVDVSSENCMFGTTEGVFVSTGRRALS